MAADPLTSLMYVNAGILAYLASYKSPWVRGNNRFFDFLVRAVYAVVSPWLAYQFSETLNVVWFLILCALWTPVILDILSILWVFGRLNDDDDWEIEKPEPENVLDTKPRVFEPEEKIERLQIPEKSSSRPPIVRIRD